MIIAIDIETYEYNEKENVYEPVLNAREFILGCAMTEDMQVFYFYNNKDMYEWITSQIEENERNGKRTFIYGHNIEYDWYGIAKENLLDKKIKYINFNPFIALYGRNGYLLDTMAFYRMSLEKVGESLGYKKGEMPMRVKSPEELKKYLRRDVEITIRAILNLKRTINELGFNPRKLLTAGQLAMSSFLTFCKRKGIEKSIMKYNVYTKQMEVIRTKYEKEIREAYRGGNNTAYQVGKFDNVTLIDINGLYGYSMIEMEFPNLKTEKYIKSPKVEELNDIIKDKIGVIQCKIQAPNISFGYLAIRYSGYQLFPTNIELNGTWTIMEIKKAIELGYEIKEINYIITWEKQEINPLKEFMVYLYELEKKCETKDQKSPIKLMRNNLYGKFAQSRTNKEYKIVTRAESQEYLEKGYEIMSNTDNKYIMKKDGIKYVPKYVNAIISTLITAKARDILYSHITKIPKEDMLYCDTDSIMFKGNHINKFNIGKEIGEFKIESQGSAKILGEKRYYINEDVKVSGVPKRYIQKENVEEERNIVIKRMRSLQVCLLNGLINDVGKFDDVEIEMKTSCKNMIPLPSSITEIGLTWRF